MSIGDPGKSAPQITWSFWGNQKHQRGDPDRVAGLLLLDTGPMNDSGSAESANVHARRSREERAALQQAKGAALTALQGLRGAPGGAVHASTTPVGQ